MNVVRRGVDKFNHLLTYVLVGLLHVWRTLISPLYGDVCRYYPSCSAYGLEAVKTHGPWRGSWLTARRLARCVPWAKTRGFDPVPAPKKCEETQDVVRVSADSPNRGA